MITQNIVILNRNFNLFLSYDISNRYDDNDIIIQTESGNKFLVAWKKGLLISNDFYFSEDSALFANDSFNEYVTNSLLVEKENLIRTC